MSSHDEWILEPSLARANRLRTIGITNMHACIKGMPVVSDALNHQIAEYIVRLQGHMSSKKAQHVFRNDNLYVVHKPFHLKTIVPVFVCDSFCAT